MNNKRKSILGIVLVLLIIGVPCSVYAYNGYNYNKFYNEGQAMIENEKYDEAILNFNNARNYGKKHSEIISEQVELVKKLKISKSTYESGLNKLEEKKYLEGISIFEMIKKEDSKRYELAQEKIIECRNLYIDENIDKAKKEATDKRYIQGIEFLDLALAIDSENEQALNLKNEYNNLYINENVDMATKEADAKKYNEAIKYLDIVLKAYPKNEQALKLKDEYNKAIEKEKQEKARREQEEKARIAALNKSLSAKTNNSSSNKSSNQSNVEIPRQEESKAVLHVQGVDAMKKEFEKIGFVFESDTVAMYNKNGIKIGLINCGEYWQLATKTWGNKEEDIFYYCMIVILGSDTAWSNLIYIDYAIEMPRTTHKSPNVMTFVNNDTLVVYVYIPKE